MEDASIQLLGGAPKPLGRHALSLAPEACGAAKRGVDRRWRAQKRAFARAVPFLFGGVG